MHTEIQSWPQRAVNPRVESGEDVTISGIAETTLDNPLSTVLGEEIVTQYRNAVESVCPITVSAAVDCVLDTFETRFSLHRFEPCDECCGVVRFECH